MQDSEGQCCSGPPIDIECCPGRVQVVSLHPLEGQQLHQRCDNLLGSRIRLSDLTDCFDLEAGGQTASILLVGRFGERLLVASRGFGFC